jgi:C4-dicarboxylate transporter DctQ subunit
VLSRALTRVEEALIAVLLASMTLVTFSQVVARYGFNSGWVWSLEATTTMFGALLMVGISRVMRVRAHMNVDALVKVLPKPLQRAAGVMAIAACFLYLAIMLVGSLQLVQHLHELGTRARDLPLMRWVIMLLLPVGFALFGLRLGQVSMELLRGRGVTLGQAHDVPRTPGGV